MSVSSNLTINIQGGSSTATFTVDSCGKFSQKGTGKVRDLVQKATSIKIQNRDIAINEGNKEFVISVLNTLQQQNSKDTKSLTSALLRHKITDIESFKNYISSNNKLSYPLAKFFLEKIYSPGKDASLALKCCYLLATPKKGNVNIKYLEKALGILTESDARTWENIITFKSTIQKAISITSNAPKKQKLQELHKKAEALGQEMSTDDPTNNGRSDRRLNTEDGDTVVLEEKPLFDNLEEQPLTQFEPPKKPMTGAGTVPQPPQQPQQQQQMPTPAAGPIGMQPPTAMAAQAPQQQQQQQQQQQTNAAMAAGRINTTPTATLISYNNPIPPNTPWDMTQRPFNISQMKQGLILSLFDLKTQHILRQKCMSIINREQGSVPPKLSNEEKNLLLNALWHFPISSRDDVKFFISLVKITETTNIHVTHINFIKNSLSRHLETITTKIGGMSDPAQAATAAKEFTEDIKAAKKAGIDVDGAKDNLKTSLETIATSIQNISNPSEAATSAKNLAEAIKAAKKAGIDVTGAKDNLKTSLETIATNIKDMDNPSEAATAAKNLAEAINAAAAAGIDVDDAKKALAGSLETIATNIKDMDNPSEAATAAKNLAEAIATAGLAPKDIGNAAIMCQLVADGTLVPKGNGEFTAKGFPTDEGNRIWLNKEGNFQMDITVEYNNVMLSYLSKFKSDINEAFGQKIITINVKALEESLKDTQKALKKNAFIFYDFTDNPPIMFTQRRSLFSKLESSVLSYDSDNSKWQKTKKSKSASTVPDFIDTTTQQQPNNSQLRITKNSVTNTNNGNNNDTQREELLKFLQGYRPTNDNSSASTTSAANAPTN